MTFQPASDAVVFLFINFDKQPHEGQSNSSYSHVVIVKMQLIMFVCEAFCVSLYDSIV